MPCAIPLDDFEQQDLVGRKGQLRQGEDRPLLLAPPDDCRIVAGPDDVERLPLLRRALGQLAVSDDESATVHLERNVRLVANLRVDVDHVAGDVDAAHLDLDAVFFGADAFQVLPVLPVDVRQHPFHRRGLLAPDFLQQHPSFGRSLVCGRGVGCRDFERLDGRILGIARI